MPDTIILEAKPREVSGRQVRALRRGGVIPAVLYGHNVPSQSLSVDAKTFEKVYKQAGESTLVDLKIGQAEPVKVLIQDVQPHHITLKPLHADFYQVSMTEKLTAKIPFKFTGESPAVKELGAVLVKNMQEVEVECLPQDLVHEIEVDLSALKAFGDALHLRDIALPAGIAVKAKPEAVIVLTQEPRKEEEAAPTVDEKAAIEQIGKAGEEKKAEEGEEEEGKEKGEEKKEKKEEKKEKK